MPGYKYGGKPAEKTIPRPRIPGQFDPSACGTYAGYRRHKVANIPVCENCRTACVEYFRARRANNPPTPRRGFTTEKCGTPAGRKRHDYHNTPPCDPCKNAATEYQRKWRATRKKTV